VDVVLALDASTSMLDGAGGGQSKLAAARVAARVLLGALRPSADQAAVVAFSDDASVLQPLSADLAALGAALDRITVHEHTRIDRAIEEASGELASAHRRPANRPVLVLLTDGRANPVPAEVAEQRATTAKAAGITVFTVGLGADVDSASLRRIASSADHYFEAPDAAALAGVYHRIAVRLPCPGGTWWGQGP
jgi:Ca-activated chloride channel family protein